MVVTANVEQCRHLRAINNVAVGNKPYRVVWRVHQQYRGIAVAGDKPRRMPVATAYRQRIEPPNCAIAFIFCFRINIQPLTPTM